MAPSTEVQPSIVSTSEQLKPGATPGTTLSANGQPEPGKRRPPWENVSLLWWVFAANVFVFVLAVALLAWTPVTVHRVATPNELLALVIGTALMLALDLVLLRRTLAPLRRLATVMGAVDPTQPGRRAEEPGPEAGREVVALAQALNAMLDRLEDERRDSGRRALAAQEDERLRIARELHDEVGQTLTAVALRAERAAGTPSEQTDALSEIAETVLRSLADVQRIGRELRPEALDDLGLVNALIALCSRIEKQASVEIDRDLDWELPALSAEVELVIYRVAQEALTNAVRHAHPSRICLSLKCFDGRVRLAVRDDGRGLPSAATPEPGAGIGMAGMRERALLIGADLEVSSASGEGTEIVLQVPAMV